MYNRKYETKKFFLIRLKTKCAINQLSYIKNIPLVQQTYIENILSNEKRVTVITILKTVLQSKFCLICFMHVAQNTGCQYVETSNKNTNTMSTINM